MTRESIAEALGEVAVSVVRQRDIRTNVKTISPAFDGNSVITVELAHKPDWLHKLFPGKGIGARVDEIAPIFCPNVVNDILQTGLRQ